jgi:glycosyltransferase involved in cell wall biosynthesis
MSVPRDTHKAFSYADPSKKAADHLNALIESNEIHEDIVIVDKKLEAKEEAKRAEATPLEAEEAPAPQVAAADEVRKGTPIIQAVSDRESVRLLIVTKNVTMRQLGSMSQRRLVELSKIFAEIHVVILNEFTEKTISTVRLTDNVWLYSTDSKSSWRTGFDAYRIANEQLIFAGAFRADIIVTEDPFEAGAVGYALARKYDRPLQVHVLEDIFSPDFLESPDHTAWHSFLAHFVLGRADSARTSTEFVRENIAHAFPDLASTTEVLPVYYNLETWRDTTPSFSLKERYPHLNFFILHVSRMHAQSHTMEVINGVAPILRTYPTMGLIIVGNGPYRPALEKHVIALGIQRQVEFEPVPDEIISHMKSANLLIHVSADATEDLAILEAAAVRLPIIASNMNIGGALFKDNESAYICNGADPACVSYKLKEFIQDNQTRIRFGLAAQSIVFERIEQDYNAYLMAYRSSIERCTAAGTQVA